MATTFDNKCIILADLWMNYRDDEDFEDYIAYNDLGLPLAYAISAGIVEESEQANNFVNEAFDLLLAGLGIEEDSWDGYEMLDELLLLDEDEKEPLDETDEGEGSEDEEEDPIRKSYNQGYEIGYTEGVRDEQNRVQLVCEQAVETYIEAGKGTKAVFWREAAKDLEPIDWENMVIPEDDF